MGEQLLEQERKKRSPESKSDKSKDEISSGKNNRANKKSKVNGKGNVVKKASGAGGKKANPQVGLGVDNFLNYLVF